ncbi:cellulose synthase/poly-beta-1,6-N-acetylglucosamine synthase-like glycosyltransferase [Bradyrhizobium huanghuaihaiense]|uniref:Cellulose synthase/poly-beta-1,6-N-acetylglucosamine synthase-like glycosyltransferase n=1 Tax=Bradyrhizobium huanghuaihaiense TaxID=990078 RepID=A0A562S5H1_9BRAD|nr:glycosyltransferase family 2 protein [Bradyrhizobium huanghuaihaiense]TWI75986.1 cellulose synthase/poly-beta-1,6-N-acetylglucosamine synthase-like glycosyltransferase [Bradyrhizobium huanghuaihaiense]
MPEALQLIADMNWIQLALAVIIFDIPRYTFSLLSLSLLGLTGALSQRETPIRASVSVIVPAFNGGPGLLRSIEALRRQTLAPLEIIVVDDGSTDDTRAIAEEARAAGLVDMVICHGTRCGRSAAINAAARFASGELLLTVDADTLFEPAAVAGLASAFTDPRVAGASCNIAISNETASIWTRLQSIEYLMSISAGRTILDTVDAIACLSGACSMYRRDVFMRHGGLDVGPGEDLEFSLRLRRLGYLVRFVPEAWVATAGPASGLGLLRQRARWDRDALRIRLIMYGELRFFHRLERLPDTLQRLDFILFDLIPTLSFPFYLVYLMALLGIDAFRLLAAIYVLLTWISFFNLGLAFALFKRAPRILDLGAALVFPVYQSVYLKCARLVSYSSEIIFAASRDDDFVPPRVRRALFSGPEGARR